MLPKLIGRAWTAREFHFENITNQRRRPLFIYPIIFLNLVRWII